MRRSPRRDGNWELTVLIVAGLVVTVLRFLAYRARVFAPRRHDVEQSAQEGIAKPVR